MNKEIQIVTTADADKIIAELEKDFYDIPFGNTEFQTRAFVMAASITPERMYRAIGLQMLSILNNLKEIVFKKKMTEIDRQEKLEKLNDPAISKWDRARLELELDHEASVSKFGEKLFNDAVVELNVLYSEYVKLPKFTREQFESAEANYFEQSLERQSRGIDGAVGSLINMREDLPAIDEYLTQVQKNQILDSKTLENLRLNMKNQFEKVREAERQRALELAKSQVNTR
jgi:hypothetical protein